MRDLGYDRAHGLHPVTALARAVGWDNSSDGAALRRSSLARGGRKRSDSHHRSSRMGPDDGPIPTVRSILPALAFLGTYPSGCGRILHGCDRRFGAPLLAWEGWQLERQGPGPEIPP